VSPRLKTISQKEENLINNESSITSMKILNIFAIILLIVGLIVGMGIGSIALPKTIAKTKTLTQTSVLTKIQPATITKTIKEVVKETEIHSIILTKTSYFMKTLKEIKTISTTLSKLIFITTTESFLSTQTITVTLTRTETAGETTHANCDPAYPDVCIPPPPPDLDCKDIPYRNFRVLPPDPHHFDKDGDGIGCET